MANAMPAMPKKGANFGVNSLSAIIVALARDGSATGKGGILGWRETRDSRECPV